LPEKLCRSKVGHRSYKIIPYYHSFPISLNIILMPVKVKDGCPARKTGGYPAEGAVINLHP